MTDLGYVDLLDARDTDRCRCGHLVGLHDPEWACDEAGCGCLLYRWDGESRDE